MELDKTFTSAVFYLHRNEVVGYNLWDLRGGIQSFLFLGIGRFLDLFRIIIPVMLSTT